MFLLFISFYSGQAQIHTKMPMLMSYPEMIQVNAKYYIRVCTADFVDSSFSL